MPSHFVIVLPISETGSNRHKSASELEKQWTVRMLGGEIWLNRPYRFRRPSEWPRWGKMQSELLHGFKDNWEESHIYIRVYSYEIEYYTHILKPGTYEQVSGTPRGQYLLLVPDCRDRVTVEAVLSSAGFVPLAKTIFILNMNPPKWQETVRELFEITEKLSKGHQVGEFEGQLSNCHCICYTMDEDLIIAKLDLAEDQLLSILQSVAQTEKLDLVVLRDNKDKAKI